MAKAIVVVRQLKHHEAYPSAVIQVKETNLMDKEIDETSWLNELADAHIKTFVKKFPEYANATWTRHIMEVETN